MFQTPLQVAAESGHTEAVQELTQAGADVFAQDKNGYLLELRILQKWLLHFVIC